MDLFSGMRPHEPADLKLKEINNLVGHEYFDLRSHDPALGPVLISELKTGKTSNAGRVVPVSPALVELGILERRDELLAMGAVHFMPETVPYVRESGSERSSQELSKHFRNNKSKFGITRFDVKAYSLRDNYKDELISHKVDDEVRERLIGHAANSAKSAYGSMGELLEPVWESVTEIDNPAMLQIVETLRKAQIAAESGELTLVKPYLDKSNWKRDV